jgi:predicted 3-demethylubiquinone-9 3-methyltransferase (glyoxalase superfamily)
MVERPKDVNDMQKIAPFLWFDGKAEEAAKFYTSIFKNSRIGSVSRYGEAGPGPKGTVMSVTFELDGQRFMALNGGPQFTFTPAISFFVNCETQEEVDELWEKLSEGGQKNRCGWLQDLQLVQSLHSAGGTMPAARGVPAIGTFPKAL